MFPTIFGSDPDWAFPSLQRLPKSSSFGFVLTKFIYRDIDPAHQAIELTVLIFIELKGRWIT